MVFERRPDKWIGTDPQFAGGRGFSPGEGYFAFNDKSHPVAKLFGNRHIVGSEKNGFAGFLLLLV
jgi:hypothetical protein